jgi:hypothetical protein
MSQDYASLLVDAGEYSARSDIAQHFDRFLRFAEAKLNRALRLGEMEVQADLALTNGDGTLPDNFLEVREVLLAPNQSLRSIALSTLSARYGTGGGQPLGYAIVGNTLFARPKWSGNLSLVYYGAIPPLTRDNPTNWLLTKAPDVYLYSVVEEVAIWERAPDKVAAAQGMRVQAMAGLAQLDWRQRWGNSRISIGGPTP